MDTCVHTHEIRQSLLIHETPLCDSHSPHGPLGSDQDSGLDRLPENPVKHTHTLSVSAAACGVKVTVTRITAVGALTSAAASTPPSVRPAFSSASHMTETHTHLRTAALRHGREERRFSPSEELLLGTNSIRDASTFRNTPALSALEVRVSHTERNVRRY